MKTAPVVVSLALGMLLAVDARPADPPPLVTPAAVARELPANAPISRTGAYSPYELETIRNAETSLDGKVDRDPHGKRIESIEVVALDVIEKRDPLPGALNIVHVTTKEYIVRREMLFKVGDPYVQVVVDETARNLRALVPLSVVLVVPFQGSTPDSVRVVAITKDIWSLRISWDVLVTPGGLERLLLLPGEINVAGSHQTAQARYLYQPESTTLGLRYYIPRILNSRIFASADANLILNNRSGHVEGSSGVFGVGQPLYSTRTEWSWGVNGGWSNQIARRYVNAALSSYTTPLAPDAKGIPYQWRADGGNAAVGAVRSFGWARKNDIAFGYNFSRQSFTTLSEPSGQDPVVVSEFVRTRVPKSDTRSGPYVQWHAYTTDFLRVLDNETLGLQEDVRLGYDFYLRAQPIFKELGASRSYFELYAGLQYTLPLRDGIVRANIEAVGDFQPNDVPDSSISADLHIATPRTPIGRLVFDARYLNRLTNYLNRNSYLGGDSRLRGFPSSFFVGEDYVVANLEFRTRPVQLWSIQLGGAAFYDAGGVASDKANPNVYQAVGFGFRFLFPQLDRTVFRGDLGFPIVPEGLPRGVAPVSFFATFDQAFGLPGVGP